MTAVKVLLFAVSTLGMWETVRRYFRGVDVSFVPGITVAAQTAVLFFAGLFNLLAEATYGMTLAGAAGLAVYIVKDRNIKFLKAYLKPSFLFLAAGMIALGLMLRGKIFTRFDNFSHWALVVRRMLETNRFPTFADRIIMFQEYPVGSASIIYAFCRIIGGSETNQMLVQGYMMLVSIMPLFALCKKGWPLIMLAVVSFTNLVLIYNNEITDLLVDTLLPLAAMSGFLYVWLYCGRECEKRTILPAALFMIQMIQIKNSGIFFAAFIAVLMIVYAVRNRNRGARFAGIIAPFLTWYLWTRHCSYVFSASETTKHAMTANNFTKVFRSKSPEDVRQILESLVKYIFSWKDSLVTIGVLLISVLLVYILYREGFGRARTIGLTAIALFVVYQFGLAGMYLFSMPGAEATSLAGVERYEKTIVTAMLYMAMIPAVEAISEGYTGKRALAAAAAAVMAGVMFAHNGITNGRILITGKDSRADSPKIRNWVEQVKEAYNLPDGEGYTILMPANESANYGKYLIKFVFQSNDTAGKNVKGTEDMNSITTKNILIYDEENEIIKDWVELNYPEQAGEPVIVRESW